MEFKESSQDYGYYLKLEAEYGNEVSVEFSYNDPSPEAVYINDREFEPLDDRLFGMFVLSGGEYVRISDIVNEAESAYQPIYEEIQQEIASEKAMERELSSPYMTGRI